MAVMTGPADQTDQQNPGSLGFVPVLAVVIVIVGGRLCDTAHIVNGPIEQGKV